MALIKCHECGHDVSTEAASCPRCGAINQPSITEKMRAPSKNAGYVWMALIGLFLIAVFLPEKPQKPPLPAAVPEYVTNHLVINSAAEDAVKRIVAAKSNHTDLCTALGKLIRLKNVGYESAPSVLYQRGLLPFGSMESPYTFARVERFREIWFEWARPGMTECEVIASMGFPDDINTTRRTSGDHEQWVYRRRTGTVYVYIEDAMVISVQD